jgi:hypothetical protein
MAPTSRLVIVAGLGLGFVTALCRADVADQAADDRQVLDRLVAIWQANAAEIKSAHIRYRRIARVPLKATTRDAVLKLIDAADFAKRPDDARFVARTLDLGIPPDKPVWGNGELYLSGNKTRVNSSYDGRLHSELVWIDAAHIDVNHPNNQVSIFVRGQGARHMKSPNDFRFIPRVNDPGVFTIVKRSPDGTVIRNGPIKIDVDAMTGFVRSFKLDAVQGDLQYSEDTFCQGRVTYPGGIVFPAAIIKCRYTRGDLISISVDVIEAATFNEPVKDAVFDVAAPVGTKVFDHRLNNEEPAFARMDQPVPDIIVEMDNRALLRLQAEAE